MCATSSVPCAVRRTCRNCPWTLTGCLTSSGNSFSIAPVPMFTTRSTAPGSPFIDIQHAFVADGHGGMHLMARRRLVVPHHFLLRRNLGHAKLVRVQNVAVRQHHHVADLALARGVVIAPYNLSPAHNKDLPLVRLARVDKVMLRQALARQHRRCPPAVDTTAALPAPATAGA